MPLLNRFSSSELPEWIRNYSRNAATASRNLVLNPDSRRMHNLSNIPYTGERFSPRNDLERLAIDKTLEANPLLQSVENASGLLRNVNGRLFNGIHNYFIPGAANNAIRRIASKDERAFLEDTLPAIEGKFVRLGQYGGRGHQLSEARAYRDFKRETSIGQLEALENQYNQAAQGFNQDKARLLEAAQSAYERGNILNSARASDINMLLQGGAYQRALEERPLKAAEEDYRRAQRHPYDALNFLIGALHGVPVPTMLRENVNIPEAPRPPTSLRSNDYAGLMAQLAPALIGQRGFGRRQR